MNFKDSRAIMPLNGKWESCLDPDGQKAEVMLSGHPFPYWRKVDIPSDLAHAFPEQPHYEGICWYKKNFEIPAAMRGQRLVLHFEAVNYISSVFINGQFIGRSEQGYLPFEFDVTNHVSDGTNVLLVMVNSAVKPGQLPSVFYWKNAGGIIRDVLLYATHNAYIAQAYVTAGQDGKADFCIQASGDVPARAVIAIDIFDKDAAKVSSAKTPVSDNGDGTCIQTALDHVCKWSPESPSLYRAEVRLLSEDGAMLDMVEINYGYRTIETANGKILLNGEPIFLKGFNRHEDHPESGGAASHQAVDEDFQRIKESGANFIRMCHYPHDSYELDVADRLGLILLVEIPLNSLLVPWGTVITAEGQWIDQSYWNSKDALSRMIARDRSHPSVCIWSVSNECNEEVVAVNEINNALVQLAKKLDPSRLCAHVSMYPWGDASNYIYKQDDIICINTYVSFGNRIHALSNKREVDKNAPDQRIRGLLARLKEYYPGKPIVMTEFGYATGHARDGIEAEAMQAEVIKSEYAKYREHIAGAALWIYADHPWPVTYKETTMELSTYGVLNRDRSPKKAFEEYSKLMKGGCQ